MACWYLISFDSLALCSSCSSSSFLLQIAGLSLIASPAVEFSVGEEVEVAFDWVSEVAFDWVSEEALWKWSWEEALWKWSLEEAQNHSAQRKAGSAFPWLPLSVSNFWKEAEELREE